MSLEQKITAFLAAAETVPAKSKLEPYADLIRALRQKRWTYLQIAAALREEFGISAAPSTIHHFQQVRAKRKSAVAADHPHVPATTTGAPKRPRFNFDA